MPLTPVLFKDQMCGIMSPFIFFWYLNIFSSTSIVLSIVKIKCYISGAQPSDLTIYALCSAHHGKRGHHTKLYY